MRRTFGWIVLVLAIGALALAFPEVTGADEKPATAPAAARPATRTYQVALASGAVTVDGVLDDATWQRPPTFTLDYETSPGDNVAPPVATEMWIAYDRGHLYVAVRAHDPEPGKIRARLRDRDDAFDDDFVGVVLDTFDDQRRAFEFFVNPLGVQMDLSQNDVTGNEDQSWDALWDSAGRVTAEGYEAEMAIPFSSLRFPKSAAPQTWGIDALRIWPRDLRRRLGLNPQPRGANCYLCNEAKLAGLEGIAPGRNLELDPTATANATERRAPGGATSTATARGSRG